MILVIKQIPRTLATRSSDFVNHSYDYRPNWAPLSPVTITNRFLFFRGCRSVDILFYLCIMVHGNVFLMKIQTNVIMSKKT